MGGVAALDASTGKLLWLRHVVPELPKPLHKNSLGVQQWGPAGGAVWNSPTVDPVRKATYFGTGDATTHPAIDTSDAVMAVDMDTGKRALVVSGSQERLVPRRLRSETPHGELPEGRRARLGHSRLPGAQDACKDGTAGSSS